MGKSLRRRKESLRKNSDDDAPPDDSNPPSRSRERKGRSNRTHFSAAAPGSRIISTPDTPAGLHHKGTISVDSKCGVITAAASPGANISDRVLLPSILAAAAKNLKDNDIALQKVVTDKGFVKGSVLKWVEEHGITGYLPAQKYVNVRGNFGIEYFLYQSEGDFFPLPAGKKLPFRRINNAREARVYRAQAGDCRDCPLRSQCTASKQGRMVTVSIYDDYYRRVAQLGNVP